MAYWILAKYTRPNTDVAWFSPSADVIDKVNEYKDSDPAKITHYEVKESDDGLKQYIKLGFVDQAESLNFLAESEIQDNENARALYLSGTTVSGSVEDFEDKEPTI